MKKRISILNLLIAIVCFVFFPTLGISVEEPGPGAGWSTDGCTNKPDKNDGYCTYKTIAGVKYYKCDSTTGRKDCVIGGSGTT